MRSEDDIKVDLENAIIEAIKAGYSTFITGCACGVDIWAGEIVLRLKYWYPDIKLIAAVPFTGFDKRWPMEWKKRLKHLLNESDFVKVISSPSIDNVYQRRNEWMVNNSGKVIAVFNGQPSGTKNTINYARKQKVPVHIIRG